MTDLEWLAIYEYYMRHENESCREIAGRFGVGQSTMHRHFARLRLPLYGHRRKAARPKTPPKYPRDRVLELSAQYLASPLTAKEFAARHKIELSYLHELFRKYDCPKRGKRRRRPSGVVLPKPRQIIERRPQWILSTDDRCAQMPSDLGRPKNGDNVFCAHCPCQPICDAWQCRTCEQAHNGTCACWSPRLREKAGWQAAFDKWAANRKMKNEWRRHYEGAECDVTEAFRRGRFGWKQNRLTR